MGKIERRGNIPGSTAFRDKFALYRSSPDFLVLVFEKLGIDRSFLQYLGKRVS